MVRIPHFLRFLDSNVDGIFFGDLRQFASKSWSAQDEKEHRGKAPHEAKSGSANPNLLNLLNHVNPVSKKATASPIECVLSQRKGFILLFLNLSFVPVPAELRLKSRLYPPKFSRRPNPSSERQVVDKLPSCSGSKVRISLKFTKLPFIQKQIRLELSDNDPVINNLSGFSISAEILAF